MLGIGEIKYFIDKDRMSKKKQDARTGERYYNGDNDIRHYRIFYIDKEGNPQEDKTRSNIKKPSNFFKENVDECVNYFLSGDDRIVRSDDPTLQSYLDEYFLDEFKDEFGDLLSYVIRQGKAWFYAYKNKEDRLAFKAWGTNEVVQVEAKYASDKQDYIILYYPEHDITEDKIITKIQVWDKEYTYYYEERDGQITPDTYYELNPRPHVIYNDEKGNKTYDTFGYIPFFDIDNNKMQSSDLKAIKEHIDDYDLMNCGLSNDLVDLSQGFYVVKGFYGDEIEELVHNIRSRKFIGVDDSGDVDVKTITIPSEARKAQMEIDEKNIYRFGFAFNSNNVGDGNITNIVIKSRYTLLDLKCEALEKRARKLLRRILEPVLDEINKLYGTGYTLKNVYFKFEREMIVNELDNAQIELVKAQTKQTNIGTILNVTTILGQQLVQEQVCEELELDFDEIKDKLPKQETIDINQASEELANVQVNEQVEEEVPTE
jgi:SPP1 family phage portal protein